MGGVTAQDLTRCRLMARRVDAVRQARPPAPILRGALPSRSEKPGGHIAPFEPHGGAVDRCAAATRHPHARGRHMHAGNCRSSPAPRLPSPYLLWHHATLLETSVEHLLEYAGSVHIFLGPYRGNPIALYLKRTETGCQIGPKAYPWNDVVGSGETPNKAAADFEEKWKTKGLSTDMYSGPSWEGGIKPEKPAPPKPPAAPKPAVSAAASAAVGQPVVPAASPIETTPAPAPAPAPAAQPADASS